MPDQPNEPPFGFSETGLARVELGFLLGDAMKAINKKLDAAMISIGMTQSQWKTLVQVFRLNTPTQTELARAIGIGRAATGALVDQLADDGYLRREPDKSDRRIWRIVPTKKAMRQSTKIRQLTETTLAPIFENITSRELDTVKTIVLRLIDAAE